AVGGEATAGEGRLVVGELLRDDDERLRPHREVLGEGAHDRLALGAVPGLAAEAVLAGAAPVAAARATEPEDDAVADVHELVGARPELLDDADRLVADDLGLDAHPVAAGEV